MPFTARVDIEKNDLSFSVKRTTMRYLERFFRRTLFKKVFMMYALLNLAFALLAGLELVDVMRGHQATKSPECSAEQGFAMTSVEGAVSHVFCLLSYVSRLAFNVSRPRVGAGLFAVGGSGGCGASAGAGGAAFCWRERRILNERSWSMKKLLMMGTACLMSVAVSAAWQTSI